MIRQKVQSSVASTLLISLFALVAVPWKFLTVDGIGVHFATPNGTVAQADQLTLGMSFVIIVCCVGATTPY